MNGASPISIVEDLRFVQPPAPVDWREMALYWAGIIALGILLLVILWKIIQHIRYVRYMRRPERTALAGLDAAWCSLNEIGYLLYLFEVARLCKAYLGSRFELNSPVETTTELTASLQSATVIPEALRPGLIQFFLRCDVLRFGSLPTNLQEMEQCYRFAKEFVLATRWELPRDRQEVRREKQKMRSRRR